jgi:hypothetical protein
MLFPFEFFRRPAPLQLILENDAKFSFFQLVFDVFNESIQASTLIDSKENIKNFGSTYLAPTVRIGDPDR